MDPVKSAFVSHTTADQKRFVTDFATKLRQRGVDAWYSEWELGPGDSLVDRIFEDGISQADALIVVLSENSINSKWVHAELNAGVIRRIEEKMKLVPVVLDGLDRSRLPASLRGAVYVRIDNLDDYDAELGRIVNFIYGLYDRPPLGAPPSFAQKLVATIPGLSTGDSQVLKLFGDEAFKRGYSTSIVLTSKVLEAARELSMAESDVTESIEILVGRRYLEPGSHGGLPYRVEYTLTLSGFEQYANAFIPDYQDVVRTVVGRLVNEGDTESRDIIAATGLAQVLVVHVLRWLIQRGLITGRQLMGRDTPISRIIVSVELKRRLQNS